MKTFKTVSLVIFGLLFVAAGINHFRVTAFYESIMPPYIPWHYALVIISGWAEIVFGIALLIPKTRTAAAWGIILLLIAVFPANLYMALNPENFPDLSKTALIVRLPIQGLLVLWSFWYTRVW